MDWKSEGRDWPLNQLSRFCHVRPYIWHIQDTEEAEKPISLLIHGTGASTHSWYQLFPLLKESFRVIALDLPGHGFTQSKDHNRSSLNHMADDIQSLLTTEGIKPEIIIGHSAGAAIAFRLALNIKQQVEGVVAINGVLDHYFSGLSSTLYPIAAKALAMTPLAAPFFAKINELTNQTERLKKITGSKIDDETLKHYNKLFSDPKHLAGTLAMMSQWKLDELNHDLPNFKKQSLFLIGKNDKMIAETSLMNYAQKLKNSEIVVEVGLGHLMHEENPNKIFEHLMCFYNKIKN